MPEPQPHQQSGRPRPLCAYPNAMKLQNNSMSPNQTRQFLRIARAIEYLYDHAAEQPDLAQVAAAVHVSPEHLQREFSAWAGISPKKMLQHISISRAKEALKNSESVAEAAHSGGLSGTGRLHDLFVGIEKMTPGEYKNGGAGLQIHYSLIPGLFGDLLAAATDKGICFMRFSDDPSAALNELRAEYPNARLIGQETAFHRRAADIFRTRCGRITLHIKGTPFQLKVWQALLDIPAGSLQSYGTVAQAVGSPNAARAVGTAVGQNPVALLIPCHRVIRESGIIGGYRWQRGRKMAILAHELGDADDA